MQLNFMKKEIECPVCKKLPQDNDKYFPFCSPRCRLVDLGGWLDEKYRISEPTREEINPPACAVPGTADREKENVLGAADRLLTQDKISSRARRLRPTSGSGTTPSTKEEK